MVEQRVSRHPNGNIRLVSGYNEDGTYEGEYKQYHIHGYLMVHAHYRRGFLYGEYRRYNHDGSIAWQTFHGGKGKSNVTKAHIQAIVNDVENITDEEKVLIRLKYGIKCL